MTGAEGAGPSLPGRPFPAPPETRQARERGRPRGPRPQTTAASARARAVGPTQERARGRGPGEGRGARGAGRGARGAGRGAEAQAKPRPLVRCRPEVGEGGASRLISWLAWIGRDFRAKWAGKRPARPPVHGAGLCCPSEGLPVRHTNGGGKWWCEGSREPGWLGPPRDLA